jgi:hypothetical protein
MRLDRSRRLFDWLRMLFHIHAAKVSLTGHVAVFAIAACVASMAFSIAVAFTGYDRCRT